MRHGNLKKLKAFVSTGDPLIAGEMKGQTPKADAIILTKP
ncbi:hypothetical protein EV13_2131 [Prochlorococcus sp. MIT 0702]|nr:hypothetical protein EV13_2131 [Prochlorococcus sp. MIT 0702]KGG27679.1 hypothetical protein EV12_1109 [Prochlorococcus sp. MIT 0701]KGG31918.1 hypothetical protein EV14_2126 [Prochlorococcus sp. MIT 0703]